MQTIKFLSLFFSLLSQIYAITEPPTKDTIVIAQDGSGNFKTLKEAVDSISTGCKGSKIFFMKPGLYAERSVLIPELGCNLTIYGHSASNSYTGNNVTISGDHAFDGDAEMTAPLRVHTQVFSMYNVNLENVARPDKPKQAVAISSYSELYGRHAFYQCQFSSLQDTVYANARRTYFAQSKIIGTTDFICNRDTSAWFERCELESLAPNHAGYVTASGRTDPVQSTGIFINRCNIHGAVADSAYLGRPWKARAWVTVQDSYLGNAVKLDGWHQWDDDEPNTDESRFYEYQNCGPGSQGPRVPFGRNATERRTIESFIGEDLSWIDPRFLPSKSPPACKEPADPLLSD